MLNPRRFVHDLVNSVHPGALEITLLPNISTHNLVVLFQVALTALAFSVSTCFAHLPNINQMDSCDSIAINLLMLWKQPESKHHLLVMSPLTAALQLSTAFLFTWNANGALTLAKTMLLCRLHDASISSSASWGRVLEPVTNKMVIPGQIKLYFQLHVKKCKSRAIWFHPDGIFNLQPIKSGDLNYCLDHNQSSPVDPQWKKQILLA